MLTYIYCLASNKNNENAFFVNKKYIISLFLSSNMLRQAGDSFRASRLFGRF